MCQQVPKIAVGIDEAVDAEPRRSRSGRRRSLGELEPFEESAPRVVHAGRILLPALIRFFNGPLVPTGGETHRVTPLFCHFGTACAGGKQHPIRTIIAHGIIDAHVPGLWVVSPRPESSRGARLAALRPPPKRQ